MIRSIAVKMLGSLCFAVPKPLSAASRILPPTLQRWRSPLPMRARTFAPIASDTVTVIIGFTEQQIQGCLYNAAAVVQAARVRIYRKVHSAINKSVYGAGDRLPIFQADSVTFGVVICNDSNYFTGACDGGAGRDGVIRTDEQRSTVGSFPSRRG